MFCLFSFVNKTCFLLIPCSTVSSYEVGHQKKTPFMPICHILKPTVEHQSKSQSAPVKTAHSVCTVGLQGREGNLLPTSRESQSSLNILKNALRLHANKTIKNILEIMFLNNSAYIVASIVSFFFIIKRTATSMCLRKVQDVDWP